MEYKTTAKLVIQACDKDLPGVFGHGCVLLLQGIAREHSLNRAAKSMGMAYSKAGACERAKAARLQAHRARRRPRIHPSPRRRASIAVYETLQGEINQVIATRANDLIASIKE